MTDYYFVRVNGETLHNNPDDPAYYVEGEPPVCPSRYFNYLEYCFRNRIVRIGWPDTGDLTANGTALEFAIKKLKARGKEKLDRALAAFTPEAAANVPTPAAAAPNVPTPAPKTSSDAPAKPAPRAPKLEQGQATDAEYAAAEAALKDLWAAFGTSDEQALFQRDASDARRGASGKLARGYDLASIKPHEREYLEGFRAIRTGSVILVPDKGHPGDLYIAMVTRPYWYHHSIPEDPYECAHRVGVEWDLGEDGQPRLYRQEALQIPRGGFWFRAFQNLRDIPSGRAAISHIEAARASLSLSGARQ